MRYALALLFFTTGATPVWAQGTPWLPIPKSGSASVSYVYQDAEKFYRGKSKVQLPFQGIEQSTVLISLNYGLTDALAFDVQGGHSDVNRDIGPGDSGMMDTTLGLTWRVLDEEISEAGAPSVAIRVAGIIAGDYETGFPHAIGDGGDGFEASLLAGKIFDNRFALSGEIGRRERSNKIPGETYLNISAYLIPAPRLILQAQYHKTMADGDLDIGAPGFSPARFPETDEDVDRIALGGTFSLTDNISLGFNWFSVLDGRNTADFEAFMGTASINFDLYQLGAK
ncbi:MAG: hypothetical protein OXF58_06895 [Gammaproteobacteria bacterium]|nr:hypothetical protein [Gammaproteobacteria bacterium]